MATDIIARGLAAKALKTGGGTGVSQDYVDSQIQKVEGEIAKKQDILESGTNIKTINGESILGSGNIDISGGGGDANVVQVATKSELPNIGGSAHTVYFVKDENATYRFDADSLVYICVGRDYNNIKVINGGTALSE